MNDLYPGSKDRLDHLRPLILKKILRISLELGEYDLEDSYYDFIKDL